MAPRLALSSVLALVLACALAAPAKALEFTVTTGADGGGSCAPTACTLRAAILAANATPNDADRIILPARTYVLSAAGAESPSTGDLDILGPTTIIGAGARQTIVTANSIDRVFQIGPITTPPVVSISGITITGGSATVTGGSGVLVSQGSLALTAVAVRDNPGGLPGGGIYNGGTLTLDRSEVSGNDAGGGGVGGGIYNPSGTFAITNSTISGNRGESGGAITDGGSGSPRSIEYSTIHNNVATGGGAVESSGAQIRDTIVANNSAQNCAGTLTSLGRNIEDAASCGFTAAGDRQNTDPRLGALASNGGPTNTHLPLAASPAINAAAAPCPSSDQRGLPRPALGACDIGAVERQPAPPPPPPPAVRPAFLTLTPATARRRPGAGNVVTATVRNSNGSPSARRPVRYAISGPNDGTGIATTGADGVARISWPGVRTGDDTITAFVDSDGDGVHDALAEPVARATVTWALPRPQQGRTVNVEPVSGVVRFRLPARRSSGRGRARGKLGAAGAKRRFQRLRAGRQVPMGATFDTRRGRVQLTSVSRGISKPQTGQFYSGVFATRQSRRRRGAFTELRLNEGLRCVRGRQGLDLRASRARKRKLWGRVRRRGRFRTRGRHSTAAVRGTVWLQKDSCTTTTTVVREGVVAVRDFARRKTVRVKAGKRYVARARAKRRR